MNRSQFVIGAVLVLVGVLFLVDETMEIPFRHLWPCVLILIGLARILTPRPDGEPTGGYMLTMVGAILFMHTLDIWTLRTSWPLFVVAAGINIFIGAITQARLPKGEHHVR